MVNYVGMWRVRFEKEDKKSAKGREKNNGGDRLRVRERLQVVNRKLGFLTA